MITHSAFSNDFDFLANRLMPIMPAPKSKSVEGSGTLSVGEAPSVSSVGEAPPSGLKRSNGISHSHSLHRSRMLVPTNSNGHARL